MIVAIHQPNYLPWLGYFAKIAQADVFVFLDDTQYSKGGYTNRVQIAREGAPAWLTVPVRHDFGTLISAIQTARPDWAKAHRDSLYRAYRNAAAFREVWPLVEQWLSHDLPSGLAVINVRLIKALAGQLRLKTRFELSSALGVPDSGQADARLAAITARLAPAGTYLSGAGGKNYQNEDTFKKAGLALAYARFAATPYERSGEAFLPGLSILDALFHLGVSGTATLVSAS